MAIVLSNSAGLNKLSPPYLRKEQRGSLVRTFASSHGRSSNSPHRVEIIQKLLEIDVAVAVNVNSGDEPEGIKGSSAAGATVSCVLIPRAYEKQTAGHPCVVQTHFAFFSLFHSEVGVPPGPPFFLSAFAMRRTCDNNDYISSEASL